MDEKSSEEIQEQVPAAESLQAPETAQYQSPNASPEPEEVRPQVIGASQPPEDRASGMAISAMVVGIVGILCSWVIVFSFPLGVTALILGILEFKKIKDGAANEKGRGMAITGIILGGLAIFGALVYLIIIVVMAVSSATIFSSLLPSIMDQFGSLYYQ